MHGLVKDETARRYGRLTVTAFAGSDRRRQATWLCDCDCGRSVVVRGANLRNGNTESCGCLQRERTSVASLVHGHTVGTDSPTYISWRRMIERCTKPSHKDWKHYGGRGITVCDRWLTFENFLADMGERPEGRTLDRVDPDGNYEPGNCRWATALEQRHNRRTDG